MKPQIIAITTGDPDGIGQEVSAKALLKIGPQDDTRFIVFRDSANSSLFTNLLNETFKILPFERLEDVRTSSSNTLFEVTSADSPHEWVYKAGSWAQEGNIDGLVTAPMSKIWEDGQVKGHTEILRKVTKTKSSRMGFFGSKLKLVLHSDHLPIKMVSNTIEFESLTFTFNAALELREILGSEERAKPIGVLGFNPHAGENGLIGNEENMIKDTIKQFKQNGFNFEGPIVPDVAFQKDIREKYSVVVSMYHDQGLIPFKMLHGVESGVQLSMGLPIVRTSVDHGTAKNISGQNIASAGSMTDAIIWCQKLSRNKHKAFSKVNLVGGSSNKLEMLKSKSSVLTKPNDNQFM